MQPDRQKIQEEHNRVVIQGMVEACAKFQRVFHGTEGEEVLAMIEGEVPKIIFHKDPFVHANNQGKRELFDFIKNALDDKKLQSNINRMKQMCKEKK